MKTVPCNCAANSGFLVNISHAGSAEVTLCCSCTVAKYEARYGKPTFTVTPVIVAIP